MFCVSVVCAVEVVSMQYRLYDCFELHGLTLVREILVVLLTCQSYEVVLLASYDCPYFGFIVSWIQFLAIFDNVISLCSCHFKNGHNKCKTC
jgi:hypothetical protein